MFRIGRILVATDFSPSSDEALRRAAAMARAFSGDAPVRITLLHVIEPVVMFADESMPLPPMDDFTAIQRQNAQARLDRQARAAGEGLTIEAEMAEDARRPATVICETAERIRADLIVIGRHGHRGLIERLLIGSTAEHVVRHAPCSVLVAVPHEGADGA